MNETFPHKFIAIEGNIGAGKTTLCKLLADKYNGKLILEQFSDNPFLPYFYKEPERYSFPVELFFMTERHKQLQQSLAQQDLFKDFQVADYYFIKTLLFAKINLNEEEYRLFQRLFNILSATFPEPEMIVYLHRPVDDLLANIKRRGRGYEEEITADYLNKIQNSYFEFFKTNAQVPVVIMNVENIDFLNNEKHFDTIVQHLSRTYTEGVHRVSFVF